MLIYQICILISYILCNTPINCNFVIKLKFKKGNILAIFSTDICYKIFGFFKSSKNTFYDKQEVDLTQFSKDTFSMIVAFCIKNKSIKLTTKSFEELLILLDFLKIIDDDFQNEIEIFWCNLILSVLELINDQKINLSDENINNLFYNKIILVTLLKRCLQYFRSNIFVELKNYQLRIHLDKIVKDIEIKRICIENYNDTYFEKENLNIKNIIYWFVRTLNLSRILLFRDDYLMIIVLFKTIFDREYKIVSVPLSKSIIIIKTEFQPHTLLLINVINKGDDLSMFSILSSVKELKIQNSHMVEIKISQFEMIGLESLYIIMLKIPINELYSFSKSKKLIRLIITGCHLLSNDNCNLQNQSKFDILELSIQNCIIDDLFFYWYDQLIILKSLTFFDNKSKNETFIYENDDSLFDKLLKYQDCCLKKQDIKILIVKESLQTISIRCNKHNYHFKYLTNTNIDENLSVVRIESCCVIEKKN